MSADDLISALFDGELNGQERAEVAKKLEQEPAAQRERDEIAQISQALKQLPQTTAPEELRASIKQRLERESLLGTPVASNTANSSNVSKRKVSGKLWVLGGMLATAAGLLLMVSPFGTDSSTFMEVSQLSHQAASIEPESQIAALGLEEEMGEADAAFFSRTNTIEGSAGRLTQTKSKMFAAPPVEESVASSKGETAKFGSALAAATSKSTPSAMEPSGSTLSFKEDLADAPIGSLVEAEQTVGDHVEIVQLTIVDRTQGLSDFQILLQKHQIHAAVEPVAGEKKETERLGRQLDESGLAQSDPIHLPADEQNLVAVFVTAPEEQMQAALTEMNSVASLVGETPIKSMPLSCESFQQNIDTIDVNVNGVVVDFVDDSQFPEQQVFAMRERDASPNSMLSINNGAAGTVTEKIAKRDFNKEVQNSPSPKNVAKPKFGMRVAKAKPQPPQDLKELSKKVAQTVPAASQVAMTFPREQLSRLLVRREDNISRYSYSDLSKSNFDSSQNDGIRQTFGKRGRKTGANNQLTKPLAKKQVAKLTDNFGESKVGRSRQKGQDKLGKAAEKQQDKMGSTRVAQYLFIFDLSPAKRTPAPAERPSEDDSSGIWLLKKIRKT